MKARPLRESKRQPSLTQTELSPGSVPSDWLTPAVPEGVSLADWRGHFPARAASAVGPGWAPELQLPRVPR